MFIFSFDFGLAVKTGDHIADILPAPIDIDPNLGRGSEDKSCICCNVL